MFAGPRLAVLAVAASVMAGATVGLLHTSVLLAIVGVNVVIAGLWFLDVRRTPQPTVLRVTRTIPDAIGIHQPLEITLRVENPTTSTQRVVVRDATGASAGRTPVIHRAKISAKSVEDLTAAARPTRRGWLELGPLTIRIASPWGLGGRQATVELPGRVKVYPALPGRRVVQERLHRARALQSGMHSSAFHGGGTSFDSLREYHADDEFRRINWRATARSRAPVTNVYREERDQQVVLVMDASRMMAGSIDGVSRFEHAIDAGHAVSELACRVGDQVGMVAFSSGLVSAVNARGGRYQSRSILDSVFDVEPSLDAPNYAGAFANTLSRNRRRSLLILLTELTDKAGAASLLKAMPILVRTHLVVIGAVRDPGLEAAGRLTPSGPEQAYEKAAAASLLLARAETASALRALGAQVEDRVPADLTAALVDRYLDIKGAGRL